MCFKRLRVGARARFAFIAILCARPIHLSAIPQDISSPGRRSHVVVVEQFPTRQETVYRIAESTCLIRWTISHTELNKGIIRQQTDCKSPLAAQADLISSLLDRALSDQGTSPPFHTWFLGDLGSLPELSARLAVASKHSRDWDAVLGKPKSGTLNAFVLKTTNQSGIYDELKAVFHRFHLRIQASSVEKVSVSKAAKLSFHDEIEQKGVKGEDKVPSGGMIWFSVAPEDQD